MTIPKLEGNYESPYHRYWEEMPCYLSVHDRDFRIIDGNRRFRETFGERIGQYCFKVYKGRDELPGRGHLRRRSQSSVGTAPDHQRRP